MRQLGSRYTLESVIGKGASGQVWRGRDTDGHARAFKILRDSIADDPDAVTRFVQERTMLLALDHPNLVRVRDMVVEGDTLALVMDLIGGGDLRTYLQAHGTLAPQQACELIAGIADGLGAIHDAGILHRDIKPENVLLDFEAGQLIPRITDFSIARVASAEQASTMLAGTPTYVAPELFDESVPTVQSDLYSLGIVFYELLAGAPPFRSDSLLTMMKLHSTEPPTRPEGIPDDVWEMVAALLHKDPLARPSSTQEVAARLRPDRVADATVPKPAAAPSANDLTQVRFNVVPPPPPPPPPPPADETQVRSPAAGSWPTVTASPPPPLPPPPPVASAPTSPLPAATGMGTGIKVLIGAAAAALLLVAGGALTWMFTAGPLGSTDDDTAAVAPGEVVFDDTDTDPSADPEPEPVDEPPAEDPAEEAAVIALNAGVEASRAGAQALAGAWTAQLASGQVDDSAGEMLSKWSELQISQPESLLIWTGDWPGTFGPSNRNAWVVVSGVTESETEPILDWCDDEDLGCWAIRLAETGEPELNTDVAPPDDRNN